MFFDWFETLDMECDAPLYTIVQACRSLGFHSPEDVRWCQIDKVSPQPKPRHRWLSWSFLRGLIGRPGPQAAGCQCRQELPRCDQYTFTLRSGEKKHLLLGQCSRCRTIYWKER